MRKHLIVALSIFYFSDFLGAVTIGLSGATSHANYSLETQKSSIISANISLDIATFVRVGLTHRRSFQEKSGLKKVTDQVVTEYHRFEDNTDIITNSIDITVILYPGYISPFVFGGIARRDYFTEVLYRGLRSKGETTLAAVPNYGLGVAIQINRDFSLKVTRTFTPGIRTILEDGLEVSEVINDTYTQLGINYRL